MINLITTYIEKLTKEDIVNFANKNNLKTTNKEIDFVYSFIKTNYKSVLNNPKSFDIAPYKNNFSEENYIFLNNLINKYKNMIK